MTEAFSSPNITVITPSSTAVAGGSTGSWKLRRLSASSPTACNNNGVIAQRDLEGRLLRLKLRLVGAGATSYVERPGPNGNPPWLARLGLPVVVFLDWGRTGDKSFCAWQVEAEAVQLSLFRAGPLLGAWGACKYAARCGFGHSRRAGCRSCRRPKWR